MSDQPDPLGEAYHALGAMRFQQDQARQALEQQIATLSKKGRDLDKQLAEAESTNDGEAVERIQAAVEELHRAYIVARDELDRHLPDQPDPDDEDDDQPEAQPPPQENDDDGSADRADRPGVPRSEPGMVPGERGPEPTDMG